MQRTAFGSILALVLALCALALPSGAVASPGSSPRGAGEKRDDANAGKAHPSRAGKARTRKARRAKHRRRAQRRRLVRKRQRSMRRGIGNQVALTARRKPKASGENPEILFRGDFESGFDGWHVQSLSSRANLFSGGTFQGGGAARFEVQDGDVEPETGSQRSEVSGPTFNEGEDLYFRDAIRVPAASSYDGPWQIVQQLHEEDWGGSPGIAVFLDSEDSMRIGRGDGDATYWESAPLSRDRWYDLVYRVYLSQDPNAGFIEVWLDGVQQTLEDGGARAYGETIQTAQTYLKAGIYRSQSSDGTSLIEHDNIVVGTSFAAVTAG